MTCHASDVCLSRASHPTLQNSDICKKWFFCHLGSRFLSKDGTLRIALLGLQYGLMRLSCTVQFVYNICNNLCGFLFQHPILRIGTWIVACKCMYARLLAVELYTMCMRFFVQLAVALSTCQTRFRSFTFVSVIEVCRKVQIISKSLFIDHPVCMGTKTGHIIYIEAISPFSTHLFYS